MRTVWTIAGVVGALTAYAAVYVLMLAPSGRTSPTYPWRPRYRFGGAVAEFVFEPVHSIDRKLRPEIWQDWKPGRWTD